MGFFDLFNVTIFVQADYFLLYVIKTLVGLKKNSCKNRLQNLIFLLMIVPTTTKVIASYYNGLCNFIYSYYMKFIH
jgi:hypothetical protein